MSVGTPATLVRDASGRGSDRRNRAGNQADTASMGSIRHPFLNIPYWIGPNQSHEGQYKALVQMAMGAALLR